RGGPHQGSDSSWRWQLSSFRQQCRRHYQQRRQSERHAYLRPSGPRTPCQVYENHFPRTGGPLIMSQAIKREQEVVVISGSHKGKRGKVLSVKAGESVLVEGVNLITKFERKSQERPEGGSVEREAPIHYSNV